MGKRRYGRGAVDIQDQLLVSDESRQRNQIANPLRQQVEEEQDQESVAPERHVFKVPAVEPFSEEKDSFARILIVDDNAFCLIAVVSLLAQY